MGTRYYLMKGYIHNMPCKIRDKAQRPSVVDSQPDRQLTYSTKYVHTSTSPETIKERSTTPKVMNLPGSSSLLHECRVPYSLGQSWKRRLSRLSLQLRQSSKTVRPGTAACCSTPWPRPTGETRKMASCFTLHIRITGLKCVNSEIKSRIQSTT